MSRRLAVLLACVGVILLATPALAGPAMPVGSSAFGRSRAAWGQEWGRWALGDSSDPLIASLTEGHCGDLVDGAFFMVPPIDVGVEVDCDVPLGTPIVFSHAAFFGWIPADGDTDEEIIASANVGFAPDSSEVTVDGRAVPLTAINIGAFDVESEPGSFYDAIIGLGTGTIRTTITGHFTILHPLTPGDHEVHAVADFTTIAGVAYSITYHIHVG
jgi:hypothetical protein